MIQDPIQLDCFQFSQLDANTVSFYSYICTKVRICGNLFELLRLCIFNNPMVQKFQLFHLLLTFGNPDR